MLKEIHEEPDVIRTILETMLDKTEDVSKELTEKNMAYIIGSGSSYFEAVAGEKIIEALVKIPAEPIWPDEFAYCPPPPLCAPFVVAISRSGETTDVIDAVDVASKKGMDVIGITCTPRSKLALKAKMTLIPPACYEKSIVVTKTYTAHVLLQYLLAISLAKEKENIAKHEASSLLTELRSLPEIVKSFLSREEKKVKRIAAVYNDSSTFFILGSGTLYSVALEGALKIGETSYVPSFGFTVPAFLHGPVSLVEEKRPVIFLFPPRHSEVWQKAIKVAQRVRNLGGSLIGIATKEEEKEVSTLCDETITLPQGVSEVFAPLIYVTPLQVLAYYVSIEKGLNPDAPRHLTWHVK